MIWDARFVGGSVEAVIAVRAANAQMLAEGVGDSVESGWHRANVGKTTAVIVGRCAVQRVLRDATIA